MTSSPSQPETRSTTGINNSPVIAEANHTADQNLPERHAGASDELADLRCDPTFQQLEDRVAQRNHHVDELQASQDPGDVIA